MDQAEESRSRSLLRLFTPILLVLLLRLIGGLLLYYWLNIGNNDS